MRILVTILFLSTLSAFAQQPTQTIKGTVKDKQTQSPLPGASILLLDSGNSKGITANEDGYFRIEKVTVGRHSIQVSFLGYNTVILNNILLMSGKELNLNIDMEEKVFSSKEVEIRATSKKDQPLNEMATVSARSFNIEESNKYAGSWGDPARMARNFAGVSVASDERNDIIVRGNSPMGILWRLDGIEIPNPNHFGALGSTGGPVTILNNNLLDNSDFYTGAFPAEFGNAFSGVFDLKMRTGNKDKREYWGQMGFNGFEFGGEGPFVKGKKATYLISYRYSMLDALKKIGFDMGISPVYQDLTLKIDVPTKNFGRFSLFGIGGKSYINMLESNKDSSKWMYKAYEGVDLSNGSNLGCAGFSHIYYFNTNTRLNTNLSIQGTEVTTTQDTFSLLNRTPSRWFGSTSSEIKSSLSSKFTKKINTKNTFELGFYIDNYHVNYNDSVYVTRFMYTPVDTIIYKGFQAVQKYNDDMMLIRGFTQWKHKFSEKTQLYTGVYGHYFIYNKTYSIEPRVGFKQLIGKSKKQSINMGIGVHSQIQPRTVYAGLSRLRTGEYVQTNKDLNMFKSNQAILGYDLSITENMRIKIETYYQHLYHIPIGTANNPTYSLINSGAEFYILSVDSMENKGTGRNYGVELTLERFLYKNYYFLVTTSLFDSKYKGQDGIERNTAFNSNYVVNALSGFEKKIGKSNILCFDAKIAYAGGKRYIPVKVAESMVQGKTIYDYSHAFNKRYDSYYRIDLRIGFKLNSSKISQEFALDLQNLTNHKNLFMETFDPKSGEFKSMYQMGFFPMMTWRILF